MSATGPAKTREKVAIPCAASGKGQPNSMRTSIARSDWPTDAHWARVLARAERLGEQERLAARNELARIYAVDGQGICAMDHQAVWSQSTWPGRFELLELGHAAAVEPPNRRFINRLRNAREHFGAAAELRARQMLRQSGAKVRPAPKGKSPGLAEFISTWASGAEAIVEVKALHQGTAIDQADRVVVATQQELQSFAGEISGFQGKVRWSDALMDAPPDDLAILFTTRFAMAQAKALAVAGQAGCVSLESIGTLELTPNAESRELRIDYGTYAPSNEAIFERLRRPLEKAVEQCATHAHLPGIAVLDVDACGLARNALSLLQSWAECQPQLGIIVLIEREHAAIASYGNVRLIGGPRADEVADVGDAFEYCEAGHLHYQPLCSPATPCESLFWLSRGAA